MSESSGKDRRLDKIADLGGEIRLVKKLPSGSKIFEQAIDLPDSDEPAPSIDDAEAAYKEIVSRTHTLLKPLGFRKQATAFTRVKGVSTQRVAFQKSMWRSAGDPISFTLNLYLFVHELAPEIDPKKPKLDHFHYQSRIGSLLPNDLDHWWDVADGRDVDAVWTELGEALSDPVQRWAEQATTTDGLLGCTLESQGLMLVDLAAWRKSKLN